MLHNIERCYALFFHENFPWKCRRINQTFYKIIYRAEVSRESGTIGFFKKKVNSQMLSIHTVILPNWTWKKWGHSNFAFQHCQRDRRRRALLRHQNFDFLFYLSWSGCFPQSKHNIMKVVQSLTIYFQKCNNRVGVDLNLFKVLGHTWDPVGSPPGQ